MAQEISFWQVLRMLFILAIILVAVYFVTKFVANRSMIKGFALGKRAPKPNKVDMVPIVLYRQMLDKESGILLIEYDGYDYLVGTSATGFTVIEKRELSEAELQRRKAETSSVPQTVPFSQYWEKLKTSVGNKGESKK